MKSSPSIQINKISLYPIIDWLSLTEEQNHRLPSYTDASNTWTKIPLPYSRPHKRGVRVENTPEGVAVPISRMKVEQIDILSPFTVIQSTHRSGGVTSLWGLIIPSVGAQCSDDGIPCWVNVLARRPQRPSSNLYEWNCPWNLCSYWGMIVSLRQNSCSLKATLHNLHPLSSRSANSDRLAIWSIAWRGWNLSPPRAKSNFQLPLKFSRGWIETFEYWGLEK